jgi:hypothetical protein
MAYTDPRDYWGDAFVPLSKGFIAIALYRMATNLAGFEDVGDPTAVEMLLREADGMYWEGVIPKAEYEAILAVLEPHLDRQGKTRWKERLRQRHIKEYGVEP